MDNLVSWFEIPVIQMTRAKRFYTTILDIQLEDGGFGSDEMSFFPTDMENVSGALVKGKDRKPNQDGVLIYLTGGDDLNNVLSRIAEAGGSVVVPKTEVMPEAGYFGIFTDSEGNTIGVHSMG